MAKRLSTNARNAIYNYTKANLKERIKNARIQLAQKMLEDIEFFVPFDTGELTESARVKGKLGKAIEYTADYAEYVYNMPETNNFQTDIHPYATSHWDEAARNIFIDEWREEFKRMVIQGHG